MHNILEVIPQEYVAATCGLAHSRYMWKERKWWSNASEILSPLFLAYSTVCGSHFAISRLTTSHFRAMECHGGLSHLASAEFYAYAQKRSNRLLFQGEYRSFVYFLKNSLPSLARLDWLKNVDDLVYKMLKRFAMTSFSKRLIRTLGENVSDYLKHLAFITSRRSFRWRIYGHLMHTIEGREKVCQSEAATVEFVRRLESLYPNPSYTTEKARRWTFYLLHVASSVQENALYGKPDQSHIPSAIESNVPADVDMERWSCGDVDDVIDLAPLTLDSSKPSPFCASSIDRCLSGER